MNEGLYKLSCEEEEYLDANYSSWKYESEGGMAGLIIHQFSLPDGYTLKESDMMVIIPQGYPGANLDMFYFHPGLNKANGNTINALASEGHFGREWQRWSRHYTWNPGQDNIVSHIEYAKNMLRVEVNQ